MSAPECTCGWPATAPESKGHCFKCHEEVHEFHALDHFRMFHPDVYETLSRWPDGEVVTVFESIEPEDFEELK